MAAGFETLGDDGVAAEFNERFASATVVAELMMTQPAFFRLSTSPGSGRPKWKLATFGPTETTAAQISALNGARLGAETPAGSTPSSP
jgi:hypothetical protein